MPQQVKVFRDLEFLGNAGYNRNINGNPMTSKVVYDNHFVEDNDTTYGWSEERDTASSTWSYSATAGGAMICTTSGTDLDLGEFTHNVIWSCAKNCAMEARVKLSTATSVCIAVGFADAAHGTSNEIAIEMTSAALVGTRGTEVAAFVFDSTDASEEFWYYGAYKLGVGGTPVATSLAAGTTYQNMRVAMNSDGDATFYINGAAVGFLPTCVTTTVLLTPYIAVIDRQGAAKILYIDRVTMWQDE